MRLFVPSGYTPLLNPRQTEGAIKEIKDFFQMDLASELRLRRVTAPLFVEQGTGINDDLNGVERAVRFPVKDMEGTVCEIVHSLAKWKRLTLAEYHIEPGYGIYTDMNAIRADEELDNIHSLYVDQWDWERVMDPSQRTPEFLKDIVRRIYSTLLRTEYMVCEKYPSISPILPETIHFIHAEQLRRRFPDLSPKEREDAVCKELGAVFVIGIGCALGDGSKHDGRSADYDDWSTLGEYDGETLPGLNGDILVWNPVLEHSFELSSMGIRVDREALLRQLAVAGEEHKASLYFHKKLLGGELPQSIGGGIGQSRLCMFFLRKAHIGEIQASVWPEEMRSICSRGNIPLI
ncbi:MAG: aspartate--ammonia ligase [Bacteroidales bacterium]|nr:aspartate--ammonia ligase [Bacteroidales bacterium]